MESSNVEVLETFAEKTPVTDSKDFKDFFRRSVVVDNFGKPKRVYHGSTQVFDSFDSSVRGNLSNDLGASYYFTDSIEDVNINYTGGGPDLKSRMSHETESLFYELKIHANDYINKVAITLGVGEEEANRILQTAVNEAKKINEHFTLKETSELYRIARAIKTKELKPTEGVVYPAYLRIENPLEFRKNGTTFGLADLDSFKRNAIVVAKRYGLDQNQLLRFVDKFAGGKPVDARKLHNSLAQSEDLQRIKNPQNGMNMAGHLLSEIYKGMGYDGAIIEAEHAYKPNLATRLTRAKNYEAMFGATHYVVFDPAQIRSALK